MNDGTTIETTVGGAGPVAAAGTTAVPTPRTWDARLARRLVTPLVDTAVTPNHLTTVRLLAGLAGAAGLADGSYLWTNVGALTIVLSNFLDHTDGELARISGRSSRFGHLYDLAADAVVTMLLFASIGVGVGMAGDAGASAAIGTLFVAVPPALLGLVAGVAVALIFYLRMRIEARVGKVGVRQGFAAGFETEDVLYLLPLVTLTGVLASFVVVAAIGAPLFALWVAFDHSRVMRRPAAPSADEPGVR